MTVLQVQGLKWRRIASDRHDYHHQLSYHDHHFQHSHPEYHIQVCKSKASYGADIHPSKVENFWSCPGHVQFSHCDHDVQLSHPDYHIEVCKS